ncbi:DUF3898 domain-containing protein [Niallia nealsonii]
MAADMVQFEQRGYSPIELLRPDELDVVLKQIKQKGDKYVTTKSARIRY